MKYYKVLLENTYMYNKDTLWDQMVSVNNPTQKDFNSSNINRIVTELHYIYNKFDDRDIRNLVNEVSKKIVNNNYYVSDEMLEVYESEFSNLKEIIKLDTIHLVSHAHIDMNWLWGYQETVDVVINTIETMLKLMDEYPSFIFSLSQASSIKILEEFRPDLIDELKKKRKNGQLELVASTWVEKDTNMIDTISFIDQITYARKYLKDIFNLDDNDFYLDFEPDTFGHGIETSKFLDQADIKYYYHCRGNDTNDIYLYKSQGGHEVLSYAEQTWYSNSIHPTCFEHIPNILNKYNINDMIYVYGVGDHGGGPTKRDIILINKMSQYPLLANLKFSTYKNFFEKIDKHRDKFEVVDKELNFTLNGCFSSSSRMKYFNKHGQNIRSMTRFSQALSQSQVSKFHTDNKFDENIEKILFNQFHDILPGCGTIQTQEYAGGQFQQLAAYFNNVRKINYNNIINNINTDFIKASKTSNSSGFGAGVGISPNYIRGNFGISENCYISHNCIDDNDVRLFTCFNSSSYKRKEYIEILCWDFNVDINNIVVCNSSREVIKHIVLESQYNQYWGHYYTKIGIEIEIDPLGYECIAIYENDIEEIVKTSRVTDGRLNNPQVDHLVKEDDFVVNIDKVTCCIDSIYLNDIKICGRVSLSINVEDPKGSSAWTIGKTTKVIEQDNSYDLIYTSNELFNQVSYKTKILGNEIEVRVRYIHESKKIDYQINTSWDLIGNSEEIYTLQLDIERTCESVTTDISGGYISRTIKNEPINGLNFLKVDSELEKDIFILSENAHSYIITNHLISHHLIRSTTHPNTHPENYSHNINLSLGVASFDKCIEMAINNSNKIEVLNTKHNINGKLVPSYGEDINNKKYINIEVRQVNNICYYYYLCLEDVEPNFETYNIYMQKNSTKKFKKYDIFIKKQ